MAVKSHWQWKHQINKTGCPDPEKYFGFVYLIVNKKTDMKYVGRKQYKLSKTLPPLKGRTRRRLSLKESDWKTYTGSNKYLNNAIERLGKSSFKFILLSQHKTKSALHYAEIQEIVLRRALLDPYYYNGTIPSLRIRPTILKGDALENPTHYKIIGTN